MRPLTGREFARLIGSRGWTLPGVNGSHHIFGKAGVVARLSVPFHGNKPLKGGLQRQLARLAELTDADIG